MAAVTMSLRGRWNGWLSPVPREVPAEVRDAFITFQHSRLHATATVLCLTLAAIAIAMAVAVWGTLPLWEQLLPPAVIVCASLAILIGFALPPRKSDVESALGELRRTVLLAACLGAVAGAWCVNAFLRSESEALMIPPVFIAIAAMAGANCLTSVPRAAILGMATALGPIVGVLIAHDGATFRSIGVVLTIVAFLKSQLAITRAREAVVTLELQQELDHLARRDPLTGLANRRAFLQAARERTERGLPIAVAIADLDRFKAANDSFGHHAGDAILREVAARMTRLAPSAVSVARLGGDEFALLFDDQITEAEINAELAAVRRAVAAPHTVGTTSVSVSVSMGLACPPDDRGDIGQLMQIADRRLYADKASIRSRRAIREVMPRSEAEAAPSGERRQWRNR